MSRKKLGILLAITALAAGVRLYALDDFPPGLHHDEAFYEIMARTILDGYRPLYFPENMGMDPMMGYLIALVFRVGGVSLAGGRWVSAIMGTLAIPATWWLTSEFLADRPDSERTASSAIAALTLATMQWHVTASRTAIQPILVPTLLVPMMAALWRGLRTGHWTWFALSGALLGTAQYAYLAARVIPLLVSLVALWLLLWKRDLFRARWKGLLLCAGVSILVCIPLATYFWQHPQWLTYRIGQTTRDTLSTAGNERLRMLWENTIKSFGALNIRGDTDVIRNLPGRPALDPWQSLLFFVGILVCLRRLKNPAHATMLSWIPVMMLPTILTEYAPQFSRCLSVAPAVAIVVALGAIAVWQTVTRFAAARLRGSGKTVQHAGSVMLVLALLASAGGHLYSYFYRWGSMPELELPYEVGLLAAAQEMRSRTEEAEVYFSPISVGHALPRFVLWDRPGPRSYDGRFVQVLPPPTEQPVDYVIVSTLDSRSLSQLQTFYPDGKIVSSDVIRDGVPYYQVYRVPAHSKADLHPQDSVSVEWEQGINLIGYDTDQSSYAPGQKIALELYWHSAGNVDSAYTVFTHLLGPSLPDTGPRIWAGWDQEPGRASYPTSAWQPGEIVVDEYVLVLPGDIPAGEYRLEVGLYEWESMRRLSVVQSDVEAGDDYSIITTITVKEQANQT